MEEQIFPPLTSAEQDLFKAVHGYLSAEHPREHVIKDITDQLKKNPDYLWSLLDTDKGNDVKAAAALQSVFNDPHIWKRIGELAKVIQYAGCRHGNVIEDHAPCGEGAALYEWRAE